ncbi:MAG: hypothetical protein JWL73_690 [Actinomycetia bacterium]|nr:hypothetical protein [Actinomycetes bacterium]
MSQNHDHREHDERDASRFVRVADRDSYAMGTGQNIVPGT